MERRQRRTYEPVRKVNSRSAFRPTGRFSSRKMRRCCSWESSIEKDFIHLLEWDRDVVEYCEQPFWVEFTLDGEARRTCPDYAAIYADGAEKVWEVKPLQEAVMEENKRRFAAIGRVLAREGKSFECITDEAIRAGIRLRNIKALFEYLHVNPDLSEVLALCNIFECHQAVTLGGLLRGEHGRVFSKPSIYGLLSQRVLDMDIDGDLGDGAEIRDFCLRKLLSSNA